MDCGPGKPTDRELLTWHPNLQLELQFSALLFNLNSIKATLTRIPTKISAVRSSPHLGQGPPEEVVSFPQGNVHFSGWKHGRLAGRQTASVHTMPVKVLPCEHKGFVLVWSWSQNNMPAMHHHTPEKDPGLTDKVRSLFGCISVLSLSKILNTLAINH